VAVLVLVPGVALAHDTVTAEIDVELVSATEARVAIRGAVEIAPPAGCVFERPVLRCEDGLAGKVIETTGADAFVRVGSESTVVTARAPGFEIPGSPGARAVLARFFRLGVEHILSGADHVLFLLALFWTARGEKRALLKIATAFTVAHSVTLGATMLGALHVRPAVAEACIALSLVLVALDLGRAGGRAQPLLAGAFGLVHGLGFAGAMASTRLPESGKWSALLSFNLGVELGQLAIFAGCIALTRWLRWRHTELVTAYAVGVAGAALFFLRSLAVLR
jgi:hypothetical protein